MCIEPAASGKGKNISPKEPYMSENIEYICASEKHFDVRDHFAASVFAIFLPCAVLCILVSSMYGTVMDCERDVLSFAQNPSANRSLSLLFGPNGVWIQTAFAAAAALLLVTTQIRIERPTQVDSDMIFSDEIMRRCALAFVLATIIAAGPNSLVVMTCGMGAGCCAVANFGMLAVFKRELTIDAGQRIKCAGLCMGAMFAGVIAGLLIRHGIAGNFLKHFALNDPLAMHSMLSSAWHEISRVFSQILGK